MVAQRENPRLSGKSLEQSDIRSTLRESALCIVGQVGYLQPCTSQGPPGALIYGLQADCNRSVDGSTEDLCSPVRMSTCIPLTPNQGFLSNEEICHILYALLPEVGIPARFPSGTKLLKVLGGSSSSRPCLITASRS